MPAPQTREEFESSSWFQRGVELRKARKPLAKAVACMNSNCWQYDALVAGYDSVGKKALPPQPKEQSE